MTEQAKTAAAKAETTAKAAADKAQETTRAAGKAAEEAVNAFAGDFKAINYEMPAVMRSVAEKNLENARETYNRLRGAAEDTNDLLEDSYASASKGVSELQSRAIEAAKANTAAYFDFARDVMKARSVSEMIELHSSFLRASFDTLSGQARDMSEIAGKVANDVSEPVKAGFEKSVKKGMRAAQ